MSKYCDVHPRRQATHDRANFYDASPECRMAMCPECLADGPGPHLDLQPLPGTMSLRITVTGFDGALVIHVPEGHDLAKSIYQHGLDRTLAGRLEVEEIQ